MLFNNCKYIVLAYYLILFAIQLYFGARIIGDDDLIAYFNIHGHFLAVHDAAWANCYDFGYDGLFLCAAGKNDAALGGLFRLGALKYHAVK